jgi:ParB-like chromosome segregation protein Spo0J
MEQQLDIVKDFIEVNQAKASEAADASSEDEAEQEEYCHAKPTTIAEPDILNPVYASSENLGMLQENQDTEAAIVEESDIHETAGASSENKAELREYRDTILVPVEGLEIHKAASLFPEMGQEEIKELAANMSAGMKEPIVLDDRGRLIDGRNRLRACKLLGRRFIEARTYHGGEDAILRFVISQNLFRRHLTTAQRADIADRIAKGQHGGDRSKMQICALTRAEAAKHMAVSKRSVVNAKVVHEHGTVALQNALAQGEIAVSAAADLATLPPEEQEAILTAGPRVAKAKAAEIRRRRSRSLSDDVRAETDKWLRCRANRIVKSFVGLPEEYQKRVIRSIAEKAPIQTWLNSAKDDAA